ALVQRLPYDKELSALCNHVCEVNRLVAGGYAVVIQDTRGRYRSEGTFTPFADDAADGVDTLGWIREQPWCSGLVGMLGTSYYGATQWRAAGRCPSGLGAIAPTLTAHDYYDGWVYQGGAF